MVSQGVYTTSRSLSCTQLPISLGCSYKSEFPDIACLTSLDPFAIGSYSGFWLRGTTPGKPVFSGIPHIAQSGCCLIPLFPNWVEARKVEH